MPNYSVATTKDKLSSLIDKALAGEEVIITRHGKPTVELRIVSPPCRDPERVKAAMEELRKHRESIPPLEEPLPLHRFYEWLYEDEE